MQGKACATTWRRRDRENEAQTLAPRRNVPFCKPACEGQQVGRQVVHRGGIDGLDVAQGHMFSASGQRRDRWERNHDSLGSGRPKWNLHSASELHLGAEVGRNTIRERCCYASGHQHVCQIGSRSGVWWCGPPRVVLRHAAL